MSLILERVTGKVADDLDLVARISKKLTDLYPGHVWSVYANEDGGVVNIMCETVQHPLMTNMRYAYTLHLKRVFGDPDLKCVMRAGGEILERANIDRRKWNGDLPTFIEGVAPHHQPLVLR